MKTTKTLEVPTGHIVVVEGERGPLELLSIGDYGQQANIKAEFLGFDKEIESVPHQPMLPLEEKWVITISTQYGCSMRCNFCDVPKVGPGRNASVTDLVEQFWTGFSLHPEVRHSKRVNLHYARMGEPTWNPAVLRSAYAINERLKGNVPNKVLPTRGPYKLHPVVSTMMPRYNRDLEDFLLEWCDIKNNYFDGDAGLQLSINSTDDAQREEMFSGNSHSLAEIGRIAGMLPFPKGRKYTLNFAVSNWEVDPSVLTGYFDPKKFIVKLTPLHRTAAANDNNIQTQDGYAPYQEIEENLLQWGYDVLVFFASEAEDLGRITCGNAILAGTRPLVPYREF